MLFSLYYLPILALCCDHENASKNARLQQLQLFTWYFRRRCNVVGVYRIILPFCHNLYDTLGSLNLEY